MAQSQLRVTLPRHFLSGRTARGHVRDYCSAMPVYVSATAELLTSELVANAVLHGRGSIRLTLCVVEGLLCVEVHDESLDEPRLVEAGPDDVTGRGLQFVDSYARDWGSVQHSDRSGKAVWFTLPVQ